MDKDFIRTARAKGNSQWTIVMGHAFRNSSIPIVTIAGMQIGYLLGGSVIVEQLFSIPGLGQYILEGIYQRDYPVVQGGVLFVALVFVLVNLLIDLIYTWIDPRIRAEAEKASSEETGQIPLGVAAEDMLAVTGQDSHRVGEEKPGEAEQTVLSLDTARVSDCLPAKGILACCLCSGSSAIDGRGTSTAGEAEEVDREAGRQV